MRARDDAGARWFVFKPQVWVQSQQAWWGKSDTEHDMVVFAREMVRMEVVEESTHSGVRCDCGGSTANTTHSHWCSSQGGAT